MSTRAERPELVTAAALREWELPRPEGSKYSRGRVLVAGGSPSTPGAVMLAGLAALRVGAGVLALAVAESVTASVAAAVPEASVNPLAQLEDVLSGCSTVLVGPGIDDPDAARELLQRVLDHLDDSTAIVVDAFALGVLPHVDGAAKIAGRAVLTPNRAEAEHLLEVDDLDDADPQQVAADITERYGAVAAYQGHIAAPDGRQWTVPTGHAGLGTSGSGDVLAGAVAGLLARGAEPAQAACWGTYLHGTAGDRLAARVGRLGFLARELLTELPLVIVETEA